MLKNNLRWKPIEGYENLYLVSEEGDVLGIKRNKMLKACDIGNGYLYVNLCKDGKYRPFTIHRLVAKAFVGNPESKREVNHIDGNKYNNCVANLEWVTHEENIQHAWSTGLCTQGLGSISVIYKKYIIDKTINKRFLNASAFAKYIGCSRQHVSRCLKLNIACCGHKIAVQECPMFVWAKKK